MNETRSKSLSDSHAFDVLLAISARGDGKDMRLPDKNMAQTHWNGLGFSLMGQRFVVPMSDVAELMQVPNATRLPGVKSFVQGIANKRGRLMALIDLAGFFGASSLRPKSMRRVLAVEGYEQYFGFIVDESLGMQHFPQETFTQNLDVDEKFSPYVAGAYEVAGISWPILSLSRLAQDSNLEKLAH